jgi:hypothetical protein
MLAWERIQPCRIVVLAMNAEAHMWCWTLTESIRQNIKEEGRIPREEVLRLLGL